MLDRIKQQHFDELVASSTVEELIWMNGFLSGTLIYRKGQNSFTQAIPQQNVVASPPLKITIAFGTESGNAKSLAGKLSALAKQKGVIAKTVSLDQYKLSNLSKEELLFVVISTQGDGELPATAKKFYDFIQNSTLSLQKLRFGVIGLGDSSYPQFCQAGKDVDLRLAEIGANRILPTKLCDTDYEEDAANWFLQALNSLHSEKSNYKPSAAVAGPVKIRKKVYHGTIQRIINLNDSGSEKRTHHIEISAEGLEYAPGDSLGIIPKNPTVVVDSILKLVEAEPAKPVSYQNESWTLGELLQQKLNISFLPLRLVKKYADIVGQEIPEVSISLLDLLNIYPVKNANQFLEVVQNLEPIVPRLYSIASSPEAHEGEVHLTVRHDEFYLEEDKRYGLCSDWLVNQSAGAEISFYIHPNKRFRLPAPEADLIMIGAGTGIAPFRSFVSERAAQGAEGRNWLFFGDQRFATDFLYQTEWQSLQESGVLTRINTAFSRDQQEKIYVQHKLLEQAETVFEWLENGASLYLCGAREPMSVDVEHAMLKIISEQGNKSPEDAKAYLQALEDADRYLKDVY